MNCLNKGSQGAGNLRAKFENLARLEEEELSKRREEERKKREAREKKEKEEDERTEKVSGQGLCSVLSLKKNR